MEAITTEREELQLLCDQLAKTINTNDDVEDLEAATLAIEIRIDRLIERVGKSHFRNTTTETKRDGLRQGRVVSGTIEPLPGQPIPLPTDSQRRRYLIARVQEWIAIVQRGLIRHQRSLNTIKPTESGVVDRVMETKATEPIPAIRKIGKKEAICLELYKEWESSGLDQRSFITRKNAERKGKEPFKVDHLWYGLKALNKGHSSKPKKSGKSGIPEHSGK